MSKKEFFKVSVIALLLVFHISCSKDDSNFIAESNNQSQTKSIDQFVPTDYKIISLDEAIKHCKQNKGKKNKFNSKTIIHVERVKNKKETLNKIDYLVKNENLPVITKGKSNINALSEFTGVNVQNEAIVVVYNQIGQGITTDIWENDSWSTEGVKNKVPLAALTEKEIDQRASQMTDLIFQSSDPKVKEELNKQGITLDNKTAVRNYFKTKIKEQYELAKSRHGKSPNQELDNQRKQNTINNLNSSIANQISKNLTLSVIRQQKSNKNISPDLVHHKIRRVRKYYNYILNFAQGNSNWAPGYIKIQYYNDIVILEGKKAGGSLRVHTMATLKGNPGVTLLPSEKETSKWNYDNYYRVYLGRENLAEGFMKSFSLNHYVSGNFDWEDKGPLETFSGGQATKSETETFSVEASADISTGGPSAGVSASYTYETSYSYTTNDTRINNYTWSGTTNVGGINYPYSGYQVAYNVNHMPSCNWEDRNTFKKLSYRYMGNDWAQDWEPRDKWYNSPYPLSSKPTLKRVPSSEISDVQEGLIQLESYLHTSTPKSRVQRYVYVDSKLHLKEYKVWCAVNRYWTHYKHSWEDYYINHNGDYDHTQQAAGIKFDTNSFSYTGSQDWW